jgi:hypothetical protein
MSTASRSVEARPSIRQKPPGNVLKAQSRRGAALLDSGRHPLLPGEQTAIDSGRLDDARLFFSVYKELQSFIGVMVVERLDALALLSGIEGLADLRRESDGFTLEKPSS